MDMEWAAEWVVGLVWEAWAAEWVDDLVWAVEWGALAWVDDRE